MNHRSAPRLVQIQRALMKTSTNVMTSDKWNADDGIAQVWLFNNAQQEAQELSRSLQVWIADDDLSPGDICILVRQQPEQYGSILINELQDQTISARNENEFQDLLSEESIRIILDFILLAFSASSPEACLNTVEILNLLRGIDASVEDIKKLRQIDESLEAFLVQLRQSLLSCTGVSVLTVVFKNILDFLDIDTLKNTFPQYKQGDYLDSLLGKLGELFWSEYEKYKDWEKAVYALFGEYSIPIMTIHKSKGLEYDTVVFLGLEDGAFWNYRNQQDAETCAFFVALSRAKRRVIFTFSEHRCTQRYPEQRKRNIRDFYQALEASQVVDIVDFREEH